MRAFYESPVGRLLLEANQNALTGLYFQSPSKDAGASHESDEAYSLSPNNATVLSAWEPSTVLAVVRKQLDEYFDGARTEFSLEEFGLEPSGTPFQVKVWKELLNIPYGKTISYGELAKRIGQSTASRAVGLANGRNPISIIIPCHRVIGSNGTLTGYGGGLDRKKTLLELERRCVCVHG